MNDWRYRGACAEHDPRDTDALFFPTGTWQGANDSSTAYAVARKICDGCPVRAACLEAALAEEGPAAAGNRYGMRGGLTPGQRRGMWEARQEAARLADLAARFAGSAAS